MDWRGQGLSSRVSKNIKLDMSIILKTFDDDFIKNCRVFLKQSTRSPFIGFGHSMGLSLASYFISEKEFT